MWYLKKMQRNNDQNVASFSQGKVKVRDIPITSMLKGKKIKPKVLSHKHRHYLQIIFRISVSSYL